MSSKADKLKGLVKQTDVIAIAETKIIEIFTNENRGVAGGSGTAVQKEDTSNVDYCTGIITVEAKKWLQH